MGGPICYVIMAPCFLLKTWIALVVEDRNSYWKELWQIEGNSSKPEPQYSTLPCASCDKQTDSSKGRFADSDIKNKTREETRI